MSNEEIVKEIKAGNKEQENLLLLYENNLNFINVVAKKYSKNIEICDLLQEAYICLVKAVSCYEEDNGTPFITFYGTCLKNDYIKLINKNSTFKMSGTVATMIYEYKKLCEVCLKDLNRLPTDNECKVLLSIGNEQLKNIKQYLQIENVKSIEEPIVSAEGNETLLAELVSDNEELIDDLIDEINNKELHDALSKALSEINKEHADIIKKRFYDNISYSDIAREKGLTSQAINQKTNVAFKKIRRGKYSRLLKSFMLEYDNIMGKAYKTGVNRFNNSGSTTEKLAIELYENEVSFINATNNNLHDV